MKEQREIITLDKSCYREIPTPEKIKKPEINEFRKIEEERYKTIHLQSTRQQLAEMPMIALILPVHELPEKLPDFKPSNKFVDFIEAIFLIFEGIGNFLSPNENGDNK
jgi:hypothetical protein